MGERTGVSWCDHTFNSHWGCEKVSPGCLNCYAERDAHRFYPRARLWGPGSERRLFGEKHWAGPLQWNERALRDGVRRRVFCASMADVFDNHPGVEAPRAQLWELIRQTAELDWLLLTKRISNVPKMLPADWGVGYPNVWLGISVVNQVEVDRDVPRLLATPARVKFLSCEPLLDKISLFHFDEDEGALRGPGVVIDGGMTVGTPSDPPEGYDDSYPGIDWVIAGGESGPKSRSMNQEWAVALRDECDLAGVSFFMKQMSERDWPATFRDLESFPDRLKVRESPEVQWTAQLEETT